MGKVFSFFQKITVFSEEDLSKDIQLKPCWDTKANEGMQLLAYFKIDE